MPRPYAWSWTLVAPLSLACVVVTGNESDTDEATTATTSTTTATTTASSTTDDATTQATTDDPTTSTTTTTSGTSTSTTTTSSSTTTTTTTTTGETTGTTGTLPEGCTAEAIALIDLVNAYRGESGLPAIPASPSLCTVGQAHVVDLAVEAPHSEPGCNLHSWSDAGPWSPCCYTNDHAQAMCMWIKPQELTVYPGFGYENAAGGGGTITPEGALDLWKGSSAHNEVILNQGIWSTHPWKAVGAGLHQGYAVLWFGEETDPAG